MALTASASAIGIELSDQKLAQFDAYLKELILWNGRTNLTAITDPQEIETKHFIDSLTVLQAIPEGARTLIDIGSGAGFPGIPLKIARPDLEITLLEATAKKVEFLEHIITTFGLSGIRAVHGRAEEFGHDAAYREQFDIAAARAVAPLASLAELCLPFVKIGGIFIAQKIENEKSAAEIEGAAAAVQELGGQAPLLIPISIPELPGRQLVIIKKAAPAPEKYPRRAGIPAKRPL